MPTSAILCLPPPASASQTAAPAAPTGPSLLAGRRAGGARGRPGPGDRPVAGTAAHPLAPPDARGPEGRPGGGDEHGRGENARGRCGVEREGRYLPTAGGNMDEHIALQ